MKRLLLFLSTLIVWLPLAVTAVPTPSLSEFYWSPVTLTVNGAPLTNLAGYRIYYSANPQLPYSQMYEVSNPLATSLPIGEIIHTDGEYYATITAYTTSGLESNYSQQISFFLSQGQVQNPNIPAAPLGFGVR